MPSATTLSPEKRFMGLFIGRSGAGKTSAECSFPHPIKVLDFDGRIRGILGCPWIEREGIDYDYYPPKTSAKDSPTYLRLNSDLEGLMALCSVGQCPYQTLILDSLTSETFALVCDAIPLTHGGRNSSGGTKGKTIGSMPMPGPEDYGFEATGTYNVLAFLRSLPIPNIIVSAHIIDRYGKIDPSDKYSESVVIGEKLSIRDKIGENVQTYFDHVFRFDRREVAGRVQHQVKFRGDIARTAYSALPDGEIDITGKDFYQMLMNYVKIG